MLDDLDQDSCCMFTNQTNNQTQSKLKLRSDSRMASAQFYDERFFVSLQTLLERPNELDWVLRHRGVDGAVSRTYDAFSFSSDFVIILVLIISSHISFPVRIFVNIGLFWSLSSSFSCSSPHICSS